MTTFEIPEDIDNIEYARLVGQFLAQQVRPVESQESSPTLYSNGKTFPGTISEARTYQERQKATMGVLAFPGMPEPATLPQLTRDDLQKMSPTEINEAHANGQLNELLGLI
ncbi:hypothetical protein [Streptomyces albus]|uniref:hypothetical protein n=1 Tax=Streptomyces sp. NRRL F-5917 TaxID=1463873 RepID=UPI0013314E4A|nr:hypothetical protein [Streptomyces sp. NRRL F-5917]